MRKPLFVPNCAALLALCCTALACVLPRQQAVPSDLEERIYSTELADGVLLIEGPLEIQQEGDAYLTSPYETLEPEHKSAHRHTISCSSLQLWPHDVRDLTAMMVDFTGPKITCAFPLPPYYAIGERPQSDDPVPTIEPEEFLSMVNQRIGEDPWWKVAIVELQNGQLFVRGPLCLHEELDIFVEELRHSAKQANHEVSD